MQFPALITIYREHRLWMWLIGAAVTGCVLGFTPPLVAVSWLIGLAALGLTFCDPVWPVALAVLSVPFQQLVILPSGLSLTQTCFVLVALSLVVRIHQPWPKLTAPGLSLAVLVWCLALAAAATPLSRTEGLKETLRWGTVLLIYIATVWVLQDRSRAAWRRTVLVTCLLVAPAITALIGVTQFVNGIGPESFAIGGGRVRAYGTIGQPNSFAGYLNQAWPLAVGMLIALVETRQYHIRFWMLFSILLVATGSLLGGLLASFSRGGWIGALIGALAMGIAFGGRYGCAMLIRVGMAVLLVGLSSLLLINSGLLPTALSNRVVSIIANLRPFDTRNVEITPENFAVVERMAHLQAAWHMVQKQPLLGVGPGNFSIAYERLVYSGQSPTWIKPWYDSRGHAHNYYLHITAESGLIGASAYLVFLGSIWYSAIRALRQAQTWMIRGITLGGIGVAGALNGHNLFENLHVLNMGVQFGVIIAMLATIGAERKEEL